MSAREPLVRLSDPNRMVEISQKNLKQAIIHISSFSNLTEPIVIPSGIFSVHDQLISEELPINTSKIIK